MTEELLHPIPSDLTDRMRLGTADMYEHLRGVRLLTAQDAPQREEFVIHGVRGRASFSAGVFFNFATGNMHTFSSGTGNT